MSNNQKRKSWRQRLNDKVGETIFTSALTQDLSAIQVKTSIPMRFGTGISILVLITPFLAIGAGIMVLLYDFPNPLTIIIGLSLAAFGYFLFPRRQRNSAKTFRRKDLPQLFALLDQITAMMKAEPFDGVHLIADYNAYVASYRRPKELVLGIGAVLWYAMSDAEKIGVLAHEVSHQINGDPLRGKFIHMARETLANWLFFLTPQDYLSDQGWISNSDGIVDLVVNAFLATLRGIVGLVNYFLERVFFTESQRAEYLADGLAARVSGTDAMISGLKLSANLPNVDLAYRGLQLRRNSSGIDTLQKVASAISEPDPKTKERLFARMEREKLAVDRTHPPTVYRIAFLESLPERASDITVSKSAMDLIGVELEPHFEELGIQLLEQNTMQ